MEELQQIPQDVENVPVAIEEELVDILVRAFGIMEDESDTMVVIDFSAVEALSEEIKSCTTIKRINNLTDIIARVEAAFATITADYNMSSTYERLKGIFMNDLKSTMEFDYFIERFKNGSDSNETSMQTS